eukprot:gene417-439_t
MTSARPATQTVSIEQVKAALALKSGKEREKSSSQSTRADRPPPARPAASNPNGLKRPLPSATLPADKKLKPEAHGEGHTSSLAPTQVTATSQIIGNEQLPPVSTADTGPQAMLSESASPAPAPTVTVPDVDQLFAESPNLAEPDRILIREYFSLYGRAVQAKVHPLFEGTKRFTLSETVKVDRR